MMMIIYLHSITTTTTATIITTTTGHDITSISNDAFDGTSNFVVTTHSGALGHSSGTGQSFYGGSNVEIILSVPTSEPSGK